ncbi:Holliday junction resolvase RuvX [Rothia sp. ZJ932]|nr:Holliday junction resolvase RuvX [Rothia sp. ZJ1223]QRZ62586.1 Holliday junction resolvase RuvX [Rothia sp. ZJ932]
MGIDVGNARVGVAACDPDGILATPLKTLRRDLKKNSDRRVLRKLIEVHEATEIFVGLPKTMSGGSSASTEMAETYAQALANELAAEGNPLPIYLVDERLTTVSAHRSLHEAGVSSRNFKAVVDQVAAVNILQFSLDTLKADRSLPGYLVEPREVSAEDSPHPTRERNGEPE